MKRLFLIGIVFLISTGIVLALEAKKEEPASPPPFGEVHHLGWVVKDLDKTMEYWKKIGITDFKVIKNKRSRDNYIYRGTKMNAEYHVAFLYIGDVMIEMFEPVKGGSPYSEFLESHGEGIQHVAFSLNSYEELKSQVKRLQGLGIEIQEQGHWETDEGNAYFYYMDASHIGGLFFELMYNPLDIKNKKEGEKVTSNNEYPLNEIIQYAMVVEDVDKVIDFYSKIGFVNRGINRDNKGPWRRYRGEEEDLRMHMGWSRFGSVSLEILQHTKGRSIYKDYLEKDGEGFHHIGLRVKDMDEAVKLFKKRGVEVSQDGAWGKTGVEGKFAYLETDPVGGLTLEILWSKK